MTSGRDHLRSGFGEGRRGVQPVLAGHELVLPQPGDVDRRREGSGVHATYDRPVGRRLSHRGRVRPELPARRIFSRVRLELSQRRGVQVDPRDVGEAQDAEEHVGELGLDVVAALAQCVLIPAEEGEQFAGLARDQRGEVAGRVVLLPVALAGELGEASLEVGGPIHGLTPGTRSRCASSAARGPVGIRACSAPRSGSRAAACSSHRR